jgi:hypothetical protein
MAECVYHVGRIDPRGISGNQSPEERFFLPLAIDWTPDGRARRRRASFGLFPMFHLSVDGLTQAMQAVVVARK